MQVPSWIVSEIMRKDPPEEELSEQETSLGMSLTAHKPLSEWSEIETLALKHLENNTAEVKNHLCIFRHILRRGLSFSRLRSLLTNENDEIDSVMWRTIYLIGYNLGQERFQYPVYVRRVIDENKCRRSHAFAFDASKIYYIPEGGFMRGGYKKVKEAYPLFEKDPVSVRIQPKTRNCLMNVHREFQLLKDLHDMAVRRKFFGSRYWAPIPFITATSHHNRFVFFQKSFCRDINIIAEGDLCQAARFFKCLAIGLDALHQIGYVHGDIRESNILLFSEEENGEIKLSPVIVDFGLTQAIGDKGLRGTYTSPEELENYVITGEQEMEKTPMQDCFALGITLISMFCPLFVRCKDDDPFETGRWGWCYLEDACKEEDLKRGYKLRDLFIPRENNKRSLKDLGKWEVLLMALYEQGITDKIQTLLINGMITHRSKKEALTVDKTEQLEAFLAIGFQLLRKDPQQRLSCVEAIKQFEQLEIHFKEYAII